MRLFGFSFLFSGFVFVSLSLSLVQLLFSFFSFQKLSVGILSSHPHFGPTKVLLGFFVCADFVGSSFRRKVGKTYARAQAS